MNKIKDSWEIIPAGSETGLFLPENWMYNEGLAKQECKIIHDMLKLFIPGEYGYYFSEIHEHDKPEELNNLEYKRVYYTPVDFYYMSGEYNIITTRSTEDYTYYAISLHGSSFASALTEYVRVERKT
tara:strand:+ start:11052 stop:11432 length:381 start_codon:yes stop_codon:yes gene_type:complete